MGTASHAPEQSSDGKGSVVTLALERVVSGLLVELFRLVRDVGPIALFGPILRCRILDADRNRVVSITKRLADGGGFPPQTPSSGTPPDPHTSSQSHAAWHRSSSRVAPSP